MNKASFFLSVLVAAGTCAVACASKSSDATPAEVTTPRADSGTCVSACCELPEPNTACAADAGTTCTYAVTCSEGLVLSRTTLCQSGRWQSVNDCPLPGAADERGCPAAQPTSGAPCALDGGSSGPCGYTKTCGAQVCDGGNCVPVHASAQASCINGVWKTTPLGPC